MDATSVFSDEDTGIFEPIAGLANTDYMVSQATGTDNEQSLVSLAHAIGVAEKAHGFYVDLAAALRSRRRGLSKRFENMARKNSNGKQKLISLQGPEVGKGVK